MSTPPMDRKTAHQYLARTLRSLVPDHVVDDLWDRVVSPLYDRPDSSGPVSGQASPPCPGVRTDPGQLSGHYHSCSNCRPDDRNS